VPDGSWDALPASVSCVEQIDPRLAALQSDADLVLTLVREDVGTLTASARVDAGGGLVADASLAFGGRSLVAELMLPGERPPGPAVLNADDTLVHARLRPAGGLNIARLVPHGSQGDQLFRLKSELFAGVVLDGSWEVAVYLPEPGAIVPPAALAVGYRVREAALAAAEEFVAQLRSNWPIQQVPRAFGDAQGVCLQDLKILPALEPCYVATDDALIVGWNPASLSQALARGSVAGPSDGLIVRLDRFAEADARLQGAAGNGDLVHDYAWERLEAYPEARDDRLHLRVELIAGGAS
jgi:hypothetical protein